VAYAEVRTVAEGEVWSRALAIQQDLVRPVIAPLVAIRRVVDDGDRGAAPDPYGGSGYLTIDTPQARRRPLTVYGPVDDERGAFAEQLHLVWLLQAAAPDSGRASRISRAARHGRASRAQGGMAGCLRKASDAGTRS
jgi:hypothetical protein